MTKHSIKLSSKQRGTVAIFFIAIVSLCSYGGPAAAAGIEPSAVVALANSTRSAFGFLPLRENAQLTKAAEAKAKDMMTQDYFAHVSPTGVEPWYFIKQAGYQYGAAGENLAINYTSAEEQHAAWMGSQTHRANILNMRYEDIGVAVLEGKIRGKEARVTVEFFGAPHSPVVSVMEDATSFVQEGEGGRVLENAGGVPIQTMTPLQWLGGGVLILLMSVLLIAPATFFGRAILLLRAEEDRERQAVVFSWKNSWQEGARGGTARGP